MTSQAAPQRVRCPACSTLNLSEDHFCSGCGRPISPTSPRPGPPPSPPPPDDSVTRYLCAAAHLDAGFADAAIKEYLVEPTRAVPPSPGLDTVAVLREAVAARARRRIRDAVLLVLLLLTALFSIPLFLGWVFAAIGLAVGTSPIGLPGVSPATRRRLRHVGAVAVAVVGLLLVSSWWDALGYPFAYLLYYLELSDDPSLYAGAVLGLISACAAGAVVLVDELAVTEITRHRLRRQLGRREPGNGDWTNGLRTLGHPAHAAGLRRISRAQNEAAARGDQAEVIVHRGRTPFIGAGEPVFNESLTVRLTQDEDAVEHDRAVQPFSALELYDHVALGIAHLRESAALSPGRRLTGVQPLEQVLVPAEQLLRDVGTGLRARLLPDMDEAPVAALPLREARQLADNPMEAARYYRCFRVESWNRDLTTSTYLTASTDGLWLYLEWTHCVLTPIRSAFRAIDRHQDTTAPGRALVSTVLLPATMPARLLSLFRHFRPIPYDDTSIEPERYGAGPGIRELAAAETPDNLFQEADVLRHLLLVQNSFFDAVVAFLKERNYAVDDVLQVARAKINNTVRIEGGTFVDSAIGNVGATRQDSSTTTPPSTRRTGRR